MSSSYDISHVLLKLGEARHLYLVVIATLVVSLLYFLYSVRLLVETQVEEICV